MDLAVDDQHRTRLRGEANVRPRGEECLGGHHSRAVLADIEDAVRLLVEIRRRLHVGRGVLCIDRRELAAVLDIEADRPVVLAVHPAIGRKDEPLAFPFEMAGKRGEGAERLAVGMPPEEAEVALAEVEAADDVAVVLEALAPAGGGRGMNARQEDSGRDCESQCGQACSNPP